MPGHKTTKFTKETTKMENEHMNYLTSWVIRKKHINHNDVSLPPMRTVKITNDDHTNWDEDEEKWGHS
jgi:hypothetical protein